MAFVDIHILSYPSGNPCSLGFNKLMLSAVTTKDGAVGGYIDRQKKVTILAMSYAMRTDIAT